MAIPPPPEDSNNLSTPLERLLAMEQQKQNKEQAAVVVLKASRPKEAGQSISVYSRATEPPSGEVVNTTPTLADSTTQCSTSASSAATPIPEKP